jgi:hypothetical protein
MFEAVTQDAIETLFEIRPIIATDPKDPRVREVSAQLRTAAAAALGAGANAPDVHARSAASEVHAGLLSAANMCDRLQDA